MLNRKHFCIYINWLLLIFLIKPTDVKAQNPPKEIILANEYFEIADSLTQSGKFNESINYLRKAGTFYGTHSMWEQQADVYNQISFNHIELSEFNKAIKNAELAINITRNRLETKGQEAFGHYNLGHAYRLMSEYKTALRHHEKALQIGLVVFDQNSQEISDIYSGLGIIYSILGDYDNGLTYFLISLRINTELYGEGDYRCAGIYDNIGLLYFTKGETGLALEYYERSLSVYKSKFGERHFQLVPSYVNIADAKIGTLNLKVL